MDRDEIISKLAAAFGPHKAYDFATCSNVPDGNDTEGTCMVSEQQVFMETVHVCGDDGPCDCRPSPRTETVLRSLTYGEIADALTAGEVA
jgi:hypothetical protein